MTARAARLWAAIVAATTGLTLMLSRAGLPSAALFAAAGAGVAFALVVTGGPTLPDCAFGAAQALTGVAIGALVRPGALASLGSAWVVIVLVSVATLAVSVAAGRALARVAPVNAATGILGMVAGGASGIVGIAGGLGADDRLVAVMQYFRVLIVIATLPLVVVALSPGAVQSGGDMPTATWLGTPADWGFAIGAASLGVLAGRWVRMPAAVLLGPTVLTALAVLAFPLDGLVVPRLIGDPALAAIGLAVGLRFTRDTVDVLRSSALPIVVAVLGLLLACGLLGAVIAATTSATALDAYLATTPGGLVAVLAVAFHTQSDPTLVVAVQSLRLLGMTLAAPLLVARYA